MPDLMPDHLDFCLGSKFLGSGWKGRSLSYITVYRRRARFGFIWHLQGVEGEKEGKVAAIALYLPCDTYDHLKQA